ncbi:hypothetical protein Y032_0194g1451 [Ancylostoma ceylanicum]|uniref:Uncharacterized protein n=1 Tax=Ancylostoma ceylanicum TaxID=53326 RepID=A0A016SPB6_9BILA|nr:hypothetical protein Y032_0194g1451 [Ancylostoma ceylanicum]
MQLFLGKCTRALSMKFLLLVGVTSGPNVPIRVTWLRLFFYHAHTYPDLFRLYLFKCYYRSNDRVIYAYLLTGISKEDTTC